MIDRAVLDLLKRFGHVEELAALVCIMASGVRNRTIGSAEVIDGSYTVW